MDCCGNCLHYRHGNEEELCARNNKYCSYLKEGMPCWEADDPAEYERKIPTKICGKCGQALPLNMFRKSKKTNDGYSVLCKKCKIHDTPRRKVRRKKYELE